MASTSGYVVCSHLNNSSSYKLKKRTIKTLTGFDQHSFLKRYFWNTKGHKLAMELTVKGSIAVQKKQDIDKKMGTGHTNPKMNDSIN